MVDVFNDEEEEIWEEDDDATGDHEPSFRAHAAIGGYPEHAAREADDAPDARQDAEECANLAPPRPAGPPPKLTEQQRARLHELLQLRDAEGNNPYNLEEFGTDSEKWAAYRKATIRPCHGPPTATTIRRRLVQR